MPLISPVEFEVAKGRRCVLAVKAQDTVITKYFFEVSPAGITLVSAYGEYNTLIVAPLEGVLRVFIGLLYGWESVFASEWARGEAQVFGERHLHDAWMFSDVFKRLARMVRSVAGEVRCGTCGNKFAKGTPYCLNCQAPFSGGQDGHAPA